MSEKCSNTQAHKGHDVPCLRTSYWCEGVGPASASNPPTQRLREAFERHDREVTSVDDPTLVDVLLGRSITGADAEQYLLEEGPRVFVQVTTRDGLVLGTATTVYDTEDEAIAAFDEMVATEDIPGLASMRGAAQ